MKKLVLLSGILISIIGTQQVIAISKAVGIANNVGTVIGKGIYCGFNEQELSKRLGNAIHYYAVSQQDEADATKQAMTVIYMGAKVGPEAAGESCSEYRRTFNETNRMLINQGF